MVSSALPQQFDEAAIEVDDLIPGVLSTGFDINTDFDEMNDVEEVIVPSDSTLVHEKVSAYGQLVKRGYARFRPILPVTSECPGLGAMTKPRRYLTLALAYRLISFRTRRSVKNIQGNNKYGRNGQLGCAQCRKRKSKVRPLRGCPSNLKN